MKLYLIGVAKMSELTHENWECWNRFYDEYAIRPISVDVRRLKREFGVFVNENWAYAEGLW